MQGEEAGKLHRQRFHDRRLVRRDPDQPAKTTGEVAQLGIHHRDAALDGAGVMEEGRASLGQVDALGVAHQEFGAEHRLEFRDAPADGGGRDMRALGRRRDALLLDDGDEEFESEEVVAVHGPSGRDPVRHIPECLRS